MAGAEAVVDSESSRQGVDAAMAKRILRKIDARLIPLMVITSALTFMDKSILSSASVFGLRDDTNLEGQDYSWVSSIVYFGYLFWTYPTNILIARLPVARYITANTLIWGAVVALTSACTNYGSVLTLRFLLGVAEATISPAFMFITTSFYTRDEIPVRTGIWYSGNCIGGAVASLYAFGIGHINDGIGPWRWMYIILGLATFLWAFVLWFALPDSISTAAFLTPQERLYTTDCIIISGTGRTENTTWKWRQVRECLLDPKTWCIVGLEILTQIPNGGTQNFANLVIESFGFTNLQSTLINIPYWLLSGSVTVLTGWLAGRFRQANCLLIVGALIPCVVGAALIYVRPRVSMGVQLFGYFLLATSGAAMPLTLSLVQANYRGVTKKTTATALVFLAYCTGNIAGPQFFRSDEAPRYGTAFHAIMICYAMAIVLAIVLRCYLGYMNAKRARKEGFEGCAGASGVVGGGQVVDIAADGGREAVGEVALRSEDYEDVTDWEMAGFRYRL